MVPSQCLALKTGPKAVDPGLGTRDIVSYRIVSYRRVASHFLKKTRRLFSFSTFYPSAKGRTELEIRRAACSARRVKYHCI